VLSRFECWRRGEVANYAAAAEQQARLLVGRTMHTELSKAVKRAAEVSQREADDVDHQHRCRCDILRSSVLHFTQRHSKY